MARRRLGMRSVVVAALVGIAGAWAITGTAEAAYTWQGTWNTTFGDLVMDAGGAGTYPNNGNISGGISGTDGRTNSGTWTEGESSEGTYTFEMSASGLGFAGTYAYAGGGCGFPPCTWDGTCIAGACLANGPDESCPAPPRRRAAATVAVGT